MKRNNPQNCGFTMLEMLVAMTITIAVIFFLNTIFSTVQQAVSTGVALSSVIENARAIDEQLAWDAKTMLPGGSGGFLVIITEDKGGSSADRIAWARPRAGDEPLCPAVGGNNFSNSSDAATLRILYGHLNDGNFGTDPKQWTLGRQALFLENVPPVPQPPPPAAQSSGKADVVWESLDDINTKGISAANVYAGRIPANLTPTNSYTSDDIALMHALLATYVNEFRVDYAPDDGSGKVKVDGNGAIDWQRGSKIWKKGDTDWPHLIRIRYRITDKNGRLAGSDGELGRVFEQIIKVPR